jgi:hypothetical protein
MRLGSIILLTTLAITARTARADCVNRSACVCSWDVRTAVDGVVLSVSDSQAELRVDAVDGDTSVAAVGSSITILRGDANQGERWLVVQSTSDDAWRPASKVKSDGNIDCRYVPELQMTAADALSLSVATNCNELFESAASAQGIGAQECNDTITGPLQLFGCNCSSGSAASLLALLPLLMRRRRAR